MARHRGIRSNSRAVPKVVPSRSVREIAKSRVNAPPNTPDAVIDGAKRAPSSLVQFTTSIGAKVS